VCHPVVCQRYEQVKSVSVSPQLPLLESTAYRLQNILSNTYSCVETDTDFTHSQQTPMFSERQMTLLQAYLILPSAYIMNPTSLVPLP
jgi:hypothetical protein